jgi:hypothetical protein
MAKIQDVVTGLSIFARLDPEASIAVEHDVIYAGPDGDPLAIPSEDQKALRKAGWDYNESYDSWYIFI